MGAGDAPFQELVIGINHEGLRAAEIIVSVAIGEEGFDEFAVDEANAITETLGAIFVRGFAIAIMDRQVRM